MFRTVTRRVVEFSQQVGRRFLAEREVEETIRRNEKSVNMVNLLGRVGRDAEQRGTVEHPVVVFSLATNVDFKQKDGTVTTKTEWHRISVFKPSLREFVAARLKKGDRVFVTGSIQYSDYLDANEVRRTSTSIIANDIVNITKQFLNETEIYDEQKAET